MAALFRPSQQPGPWEIINFANDTVRSLYPRYELRRYIALGPAKI